MSNRSNRLSTDQVKANANLKKRLRTLGQMFVLQPDTIVGDAFWDCQKTTVIIPKQGTHTPIFDNANSVSAIKNRVYIWQSHGWKTITSYEVGKIYPVYKTRLSASYDRDASTPHAYAKIISIYEVSGGWGINVERHFSS